MIKNSARPINTEAMPTVISKRNPSIKNGFVTAKYKSSAAVQ